jgi:LysW-gamma-L-lysine/LysW-L-ornithine aminotransferase
MELNNTSTGKVTNNPNVNNNNNNTNHAGQYQEIEGKFIVPTYGSRGLTIIRGEGCWLFDEQGKRYLDCFSNVGVNLLGHNVPELNNAVIAQLSKITNLHSSFHNDTRAKFALKLMSIAPGNLKRAYFCSSGTESVEAALKFARAVTGKKVFVSAKMGYHGKTFGSLSLTMTSPEYREAFLPLLENVRHFAYNNLESLKEQMADDVAAVVLEPIQGEAGIIVPDKDFLKGVKKLCEEHGALLVLDEVQTGMGRTGKWFAHEHFDVEPDIMCLSKGIGGGLPLGATLVSEAVSQKLFKGAHTSTFGGNPLVCAAGLATINYIEKHDLVSEAGSKGAYFMEKIREINSPIVREVRGKGLMIGIELKRKSTEYIRALQDDGLLVFPSGSLVIRLLPPLTITREQIDMAVEKLTKALGGPAQPAAHNAI